MKIGMDLDGTIDRPAVADLCRALIAAGHDVHIITGVFKESGDWQGIEAKREKLTRRGISFVENAEHRSEFSLVNPAVLHVLDAVGPEFDRDYRLADLGLRKGALCEKLDLTLFIDDSLTYCEMIPKMSGGTVVLHVR